MLRLLLHMVHLLSWVVGCALWSGRVGACFRVICRAVSCPVTLGASLRGGLPLFLRVMAVVSGPPSCSGCFTVQELHRTIEASLSMFSFVRRLAGGWREFALFLVTVLVSLLLLESQTAVLAMVVA